MGGNRKSEDLFAKREAARLAKKIIARPDSVGVDDFGHLETFGYLLEAHGKRVRDLVVEKFAHIKDDEGVEAAISLLDKEIGLHSNIPACCVEFFVQVHEAIRAEYPHLNAAVIGHLGAGVRSFATRGLMAMDEDLLPNYSPCPECTKNIVEQKITPNALHYCDNREDGPLCAKWLDARELRIQVEQNDALVFCVYPKQYFDLELNRAGRGR